MFKPYTDSFSFIDSKIKFYTNIIKYLKKINGFLNIIIILAGFVTTTITSLILSKLFFSSYPDWFLYTASGISAATVLATSLLNFFVIKDNIKIYTTNLKRIQAEVVSYFQKTKEIYKNKSNNKNEYFLFLNVAAINGSEAAQKEIKYVGK